MIFGNKEKFALEAEEITKNGHHIFCNMRLWFKGKSLGNFDDENLIGTVVTSIEWLLNLDYLIDYQELGNDDASVFENINLSDDEKVFNSFINFGETTDDWSIRVVKKGSVEFYFLWKQSEEEHLMYDYDVHDPNLHSAEIERENIVDALNEIRIYLNS